jgi:hypothetical protein
MDSHNLADQLSQSGYLGQELINGEFANRDYESGPQDTDFGPEPFAACGDLTLGGHTVPASGVFTRETPADGSHVHSPAKFLLGHPCLLFKPLEHRLTSGPGERPTEHRFFRARRLPNKHNPAYDRPA